MSTAKAFPNVCIDRYLSGPEAAVAQLLAWQERPDNGPPAAAEALALPATSPERLALVTSKKWGVGRTIRCRFLSGSPSLRQNTIAIGAEWCQVANLRVVESNDADAEVRIDYRTGQGAWSYIGVDCLGVSRDQPTMNLGWVTATNVQDQAGTVRHEFGHMLGAIHEHQSPSAAGIRWNKEQVYKDLGGPPNNWDRATIDANMFGLYAASQTQFSALDARSIMMYSIPASWTLDGWSAPWNLELSPTDKQWAQTAYPGVVDPGEDKTAINKAVIANLTKLFNSAPPPGVAFHFIASIADLSGDGYADVMALIGLYGSQGRRRVIHVYQVIFDGLSVSGGTVGQPKIIWTMPA